MVKIYLKYFLSLVVILCLSASANATHIVGGELTYKNLGNNNYEIKLKLYRDCYNGVAQYDAPAFVSVYNSAGGLIQVLQMIFPGSDTLHNTINNPCGIIQNQVCVEEAIYVKTVNLPPIVGGYNLAYQRCCRNNSIVNIVNPGAAGSTYYAHIPGSEIVAANSSPFYNNFPPIYLCTNTPIDFDHAATDPDGDSLVYEFCDPYIGATSGAPQPSQPTAPPYNFVTYTTGYSAVYPLASSPAVSIDPQTGFLTGVPNQQGQYVVGVCVKEYRNGVLLSTNKRDFQFNVLNCQNPIAIIPFANVTTFDTNGNPTFCSGNTVDFTNTSQNANSFYWDFGDPTTTSDFSTLQNPSYTYPDSGLYTISLTAHNNTSNCNDTAYATIHIYPLLQPDIQSSSLPQCLTGNTFNFVSIGAFNAGAATFSWNFSNANPGSSALQNPDSIVFTSSGLNLVTLTVNQYVCTKTDSFYVNIIPSPDAQIQSFPSNCEGFILNFVNNTTSATGYHWDFGVPWLAADTAVLTAPVYAYTDTGFYNVTLIATYQGLCYDTATKTIGVYPQLSPAIIPFDGQCILGNNFNFYAGGVFDSTATFYWDLTSFASIPNSTLQDVLNVTYSDSGHFVISLSMQAYVCTKSVTDTVVVYPMPKAYFNTPPSSGCAPLTVGFMDSSFAVSELHYLWNFGDGTFSDLQNPVHVYTVPGQYDVSLMIMTSSACIDTPTYSLNNLITAYSLPQAGYNVDSLEKSYFEPTFKFTDLSTGAIACYIEFGDGQSSDNCNSVHTYPDSGTYKVMQIVTNENGCVDTITGTVKVRPEYRFYIPNAFTPNGDGMNDFFAPKMIGYYEIEFYIFNRWGEIIFYTNKVDEGWDGKYKGEICKTEVYTYLIRAKNVFGTTKSITGSVTLIK